MNGTLFTQKTLPLCFRVAQQTWVKKHGRMLFLHTALLVVCLMLLPAVLHGQLRQLEITPDVAPATFPVFTDYPDNAAVIINSSIPNLQFSSTLDIIRDLSQSGTGRYVIIIPAARQSIQVSAAGYITQSFSVGNISAREVRHFRVEPKNVNITETGTLILRTNPSGATITIDGIPGTYTSPHTFPELLAQGYTVRIRLTDYVEEVIQVSVNPERPFIQTIDLVQTFGFLTVNTPDATLFLRDENTESEYRRSYTVRQPLRLDVGRYDFRLAREDFADATGSFEIKPNETATINPELAANFGFLSIRGSDVTVFVTPVGGGTETRLPARADQRHRLSLGAYQYRATRQDFADATGTFEITANGTTVIEPALSATFGFLNVQGADITLFVSPAGGGSETRLPNEPNQQHRLSIGRYQYRATRDYYLESSGTFEITPNQQASITPNLQPAYGTLRVSANAPTIRLSAADNNAPTNRTSGEIYLERGRRTVVVTASGYVQQELDVRIEPGERIEQSVTLESIADRDQRVAREGLPRGVLEIATDVDAEIFVNGIMRGRKNVVLTMVPGQYTVELRHPLRKQTFSVDVPTADMVRHFVELRPVRSRAITYSLFIPGVGNAYRKERRGYVYLGLFAASAVYANSVYTGYNNDLVAYSDAQDAYRRAGSAEAAANLRSELLTQHKQVTDSRGALIIAAGVVAGVYAVQFLDVAISRPRYGYREKPTSRALAYDAGGNTRLAGKDRSMGLSAYMDGTKFTLRASF